MPAVAPTCRTGSVERAACDRLDPCSHAVEHVGEHLQICSSRPDRDMERVISILGRRQCCQNPEPFNEGQQKRHGRERIARSLQEEHRDMHMSKVLCTPV